VEQRAHTFRVPTRTHALVRLTLVEVDVARAVRPRAELELAHLVVEREVRHVHAADGTQQRGELVLHVAG